MKRKRGRRKGAKTKLQRIASYCMLCAKTRENFEDFYTSGEKKILIILIWPLIFVCTNICNHTQPHKSAITMAQ